MKQRTISLCLVFTSVLSTAVSYSSFAQTTSLRPATPIAASAATAVPALVPYSGAATGNDGKLLGSEAAITFLIYKDEAGGEALWTETQTVAFDATGHYKVQLGATSPNGLPAELFATGEARWLEVQIAGEPAQPRVLLASVPYALKASDAATLGGLPASAFALAGSNVATTSTAAGGTAPNADSTVTTPGGTAGQLARFSGNSTVADSILTDTGTAVGIGTTTPAQTLDVNGATVLRGDTILYRTKDATANNAGGYSRNLIFSTGVFNSATQSQVKPLFLLEAEPSGNNTASPSATLNLLFNNGLATAETGLHFNPNGTINFATGQVFPGAGTISGVTAGTGLTGGGSSGNVTINLNTALVPLLSGNNSFTGNETIAGSVTSSSNLSYAIEGVDSSAGGSGLFGMATSTSGYSSGVFGTSASTTGSGVSGNATSTTGYTNGVYGRTASSSGTGVGGAATSTTGYTNGVYGTSASPNGTGVSGVATSSTGGANGVGGSTASPNGAGVSGVNNATAGGIGVTGTALATSGYSDGVWGLSASPNGTGVFGSATSTTGNAIGTSGTSASPNGTGVQGVSTSATGGNGVNGISLATSGYTNGVYGKNTSVNGTGVNGQATSTTGNTVGTSGTSASPNGVGVYGVNTSTTGGTGVNGISNATSGYGSGVFGSSASPAGAGVQGVSTSATGGIGVSGVSNATTGQVYGVSGGTNSTSDGAAGVNGYEGSSTGRVYGLNGSASSSTNFAAGVSGYESATTGLVYGVYGGTASSEGVAVQGEDRSLTGGTGVSGIARATSGYASGVQGTSVSPNGTGISGYNNSGTGGNGVFGSAISTGVWSAGVNGVAGPSGTGVNGTSPNVGVAGYAENPCGPSSCPLASGTGGQFAAGAGGLILQGLTGATNIDTHQVFYVDASGDGYFAGNLNVTGKVVKGSGSFKIDDPLDPANKYLSHSFVESPDMMNVYNGNVKTDKFGRATVELPEYFEALNSDFRYQLTVMGQFAQAIVATKIGHNRFVIRTSKPSVEVSWQVTGIRKDAYAAANRIPVEEEKAGGGARLLPASRGIQPA
jgi:hypothetical protein